MLTIQYLIKNDFSIHVFALRVKLPHNIAICALHIKDIQRLVCLSVSLLRQLFSFFNHGRSTACIWFVFLSSDDSFTKPTEEPENDLNNTILYLPAHEAHPNQTKNRMDDETDVNATLGMK